jgi:ribonuclease R
VTATVPAPEGAVVAVLEKRGRFLVAEPLFPLSGDDGRGRRGGGRMTVDARTRAGARRANAGDLALVQPARSRDGRAGHARVVRLIGRPEVARDVIEALMLDRGLRRGFDPVVEREAREARDRGLAAGGRDAPRRDLRALSTFTIDPADAKDFDDAVSAEVLGDGAVRVWIHIADVAAHVAEGSLVDREARRRGTSVYVPGAVEPMLPEALSSDACSLVAERDRLAVTVELELDGTRVRSAAFYRSLIRSDARLDYDQVDRVFAGVESAREPWAAPLAAARRVSAALEDERAQRGALVVDSVEPEFEFDRDGHVRRVSGRVQTESHRLIEHLMIAANEAVARLLSDRGVPCLYRVHERPEPARVERLIEQLASLGVATPPLPDVLSPSQAAELVGQCSRLVAEHVRRTGHGNIALGSLVLRSLKQAYYSPQNLGHAGLRSSCYCHFTSPIRRYPDLVCHRALLSAVGGGEHAPEPGRLGELGVWTSERERAAMTIERDADDVARCFALELALYERGWDHEFAGEVTGLIGAGAFVAFGPARAVAAAGAAGAGSERGGDPAPAPPYEGMLPVRRLAAGAGERDWWELNEAGTILSGSRSGRTLRLGDPLAVRVRRVEAVRGRVDLDLAPEDDSGD